MKKKWKVKIIIYKIYLHIFGFSFVRRMGNEKRKFANCHLSGVRFCWRLMKKLGGSSCTNQTEYISLRYQNDITLKQCVWKQRK